MSIIESSFLNWWQESIIPMYARHEKDFDFAGLHGRKHVTRTLIFGECLAAYYNRNYQLTLNLPLLRIAIAFHDAGRAGNGKDVWEEESAHLAFEYAKREGYSHEEATLVAEMILKKGEAKNLPQLLHDADVLEYMRLLVGTPQGMERFRSDFLRFLSAQDSLIPLENIHSNKDRLQLLREAWQFIEETENTEFDIENGNVLQHFLDFVEEEKSFTLLRELLRND